jgi:predicted enzyme related to lactoylglutathione lyase
MAACQDVSVELRICIDVDDLGRAEAFYTRALGLRVGRRLGDSVVELLGAVAPIDLILQPPGRGAIAGAGPARHYGRHWTPLHLDLVVDDLETALGRAKAAGAVLERPVQEQSWGRMANMADPFGHGFCLIEFKGRGYDELAR